MAVSFDYNPLDPRPPMPAPPLRHVHLRLSSERNPHLKFGAAGFPCSTFVHMDAGLNQTRMQMLGELAEMTLVLARDLQQAALAATDADEKVRLATAFHRIGRGVRQSVAL